MEHLQRNRKEKLPECFDIVVCCSKGQECIHEPKYICTYSQWLDVRAHVIFLFLTKIGEKRWNLLLSGEIIISNTYSNTEQV